MRATYHNILETMTPCQGSLLFVRIVLTECECSSDIVGYLDDVTTLNLCKSSDKPSQGYVVYVRARLSWLPRLSASKLRYRSAPVVCGVQ